MRWHVFGMICLWLTAAQAAVAKDEADEEVGVDALGQADLQEAFRVLRNDYLHAERLDFETINRAALLGLVRYLGDGVSIVPGNGENGEASAQAGDFLAAELGATSAYLRLSAYQPDELAAVDEALLGFEGTEREILLLDLRVPAEESSLEFAARFLDRFVPPDRILFKFDQTEDGRPQLFISRIQDARWEKKIIALIDRESCRAAELILAGLESFADVFVVGESTTGRTVEFRRHPLAPGLDLKYAVAEVLLPDGSSLFAKGIAPDLAIEADLEAKKQVFAASKETPLEEFVLEVARPRMNEAALVHQFDPELDYNLAKARGEETRFDRVPLQDRTLQAAYDLVTVLQEAEF